MAVKLITFFNRSFEKRDKPSTGRFTCCDCSFVTYKITLFTTAFYPVGFWLIIAFIVNAA